MILERLLPEDVSAQLSSILDTKYAASRGQRTFHISTRREFDKVEVTVRLSDSEGTFFYPVEGRLNFVEEEMKPEEAAFFLIDYIDLYFEEFFHDDEQLFIPIDWQQFTYEAVKFDLRGQVMNKRVEGMADKLLADAGINPEDGEYLN